MERLYGLSNQEFADGRATDRHENRLFPEYEILSELLARRAEPADDRSDAANVRPARGRLGSEDEVRPPRDPGGPEVRGALDQTGQRVTRKVVARGVEDQGRRDSMTDRLARAREFAVREQEPVVIPVRLMLEKPTGDPKVPNVVPIPSPYRPEDPVRSLPIWRRRRRQRVESVRHDEVQGRRTGQEEEIQVPSSFQEAAGEGHRSRRMAEALRVDREVAAEFLHRATHCPLPQRPSDETAACRLNDRIRERARAGHRRR